MGKMKKIAAVVLGVTMLFGTSLTANALDGYTDFYLDGFCTFQRVAYVNCPVCHYSNAAHYLCTRCAKMDFDYHYTTICNSCGSFLNY